MCLVLKETAKLSPRRMIPFYIPISHVWENQPAFDLSVFYLTILIGVSRYLIVFLICISLMPNEDGHLFMCLLTIHLASLVKCLFMSLTHFLNWLFDNVYTESSLYTLHESYVSYVAWKYFFPVCSMPFYPSNQDFNKTKVLMSSSSLLLWMFFWSSCLRTLS